MLQLAERLLPQKNIGGSGRFPLAGAVTFMVIFVPIGSISKLEGVMVIVPPFTLRFLRKRSAVSLTSFVLLLGTRLTRADS